MSRDDTGLEVTVDGATVCVVGQLDLLSLPAFEQGMARSLDGQPAVTLDLSGVSFLDSRGIAAVIDVVNSERAAGRRMVVGEMSDNARRVLEIVGLVDYLTSD